MATWKKIIVSGSSAELSSLVVDNGVSASILSGSHYGDGSNLTGITADTASYIMGHNVDGAVTSSLSASHATYAETAGTANTASYVQTESIVNFDTAVSAAAAAAGIGNEQPESVATGSLLETASFSGESITFTKGDGTTFALDVIPAGVLSGSAQIASEISGAFTADSASFSASIAELEVWSSSLDDTYATMEEVNTATGSLFYSASLNGETLTLHQGDGTTEALDIIPEGVISGSEQLVNLTASYIGDGLILGTANEIEIASASGVYTVGLPNDVTIGQDLTVTRNLTVLGTQTNLNVANLDVEDRFILLNSGSAAGDGGIVINQGSQTGAALGYDQSDTRFAIQLSLAATATTITPDAFVTNTVEGGSGVNTPSGVSANLSKKGNIFIGDNEDIFIYS